MSAPKIQIPVIYPSTLTEEQRVIIYRMFEHYEKKCHSDENAGGHIDAFLWLFGEDFFQKV